MVLTVSWLAMWAPAQAGLVDVTPPSLQIIGSNDTGPAWLDVDSDGTWDLLLPDDATVGARLLIGDGAGGFDDRTETLAPDLLDPGSNLRGLYAADLNNDGQVDVVTVRNKHVRVLLNSGPPEHRLDEAFTFSDGDLPYAYGGHSFEGTAVLDADSDGWLDVFVSVGWTTNVLLLNPADGSDDFDLIDLGDRGLPTDAFNSDYAAAADFDADGDVDIVLRTQSVGNNVYLNDGGAEFGPVSLELASVSKGSASFCDLGEDGTLELLWSDTLESLARFYAYDASMTSFLDTGEPPFTPTGAREMICGDLDHDGSLDVFISDDDDDSILWGPHFTHESLDNENVETRGSSLADYDGDGDLDVMMSRHLAPHSLLANDTDDDRWVQVRLRANTIGCPSAPVLRDDIGATARVFSLLGLSPDSARGEVSGGHGRGHTGWPVLHFGGIEPGDVLELEVDFKVGRNGPLRVRLPVGQQQFEVQHDDPDGDGIPTSVEDQGDPAIDTDGDGYVDWLDADSDDDGVDDSIEAGAAWCDVPVDTDGDGERDLHDLDSDDDGVLDADEGALGTDRIDPDTDRDGLLDSEEVTLGTDPTNPDTDGDGLLDGGDPDPLDGPEVLDSDGDGVSDADELAAGTDPFDPDTDGDGVLDGADPFPLATGADGPSGTPDPTYGFGCGCTSTTVPPTPPASVLLVPGMVLRRIRRTGP